MIFQRDTASRLTLRLTMHRIAATLAIVVALLFGAGAACADFDDGVAAFKRGDSATAFLEWVTSAEQGLALAQSLIRDAVIIVIRVYAKTNVHQLSTRPGSTCDFF